MIKRREKSSLSNAEYKTLPTVVSPSSRSRSPSPYKRKSLGVRSKQRRGIGGQLCGASCLSAHAGHTQSLTRTRLDPVDWIQVLLSLCVLAAVLKSMRWLRAETFEADDAILEASEYSSFTVHVSASGTGLMNKYFYRFGNVRIRRGRMKFYFDADGSFVPPTEELWVDIISCNATSARPPTMLVVKVDAPVRWEYMPIDYVPVVKRTDACHAGATSVVSRLAYLLQVRYSYNIWHTWGEAGLMSMFQTLREINQLPIATVGPSGSLHEIFDGGIDGGDSGGDGGCPWTYDQALQRPVRPDACERRRIPRGATCSFNSHPWCRPGAVVSPLRDDPAAPLIVTYSPQSTKNVWSHLYDTILSDQKTLAELEGACFEDLVVGKSSTLNFYQALNTTTPAAAILAKVPRIDFARARVDAMSTFKPFIISGQREWVERQGLAFGGYADEGLERLRQGVTHPDDEALLSMNVNGGVAGNVREEINELRKNFEAHEAQVAGSVEKYELLYGRVVAPTTLNSQQAVELRDEESEAFFARIGNEETVGGAAGGMGGSGAGGSGTAGTRTTSTTPSTTTTRRDLPVVVYMSRNFASRGVLNEIDILRYVLSKYDVVLKVTTFQEPLLETMDLLSSSDVLLGMHGAGWTNLLFMKGNASTLQLFPYGFRLPGGGILRGANYREIVFASRGSYLEWVNPSSANSYQRRIDFKKRKESKFVLHPQDHEPTGSTGPTGAGTNEIVYANTWVDIKLVGPVIDRAMAAAGILPKR